MLAHPGPAATVAQLLGQTLRLAEQPFGVAQRAAEHLDESPFAQRRRQLDVVAELTEQFDARAEFDAGRIEVAGALLERAEQPPGAALVTAIVGDERRGERRFRVDSRPGGVAAFGVRLGTQRAAARGR